MGKKRERITKNIWSKEQRKKKEREIKTVDTVSGQIKQHNPLGNKPKPDYQVSDMEPQTYIVCEDHEDSSPFYPKRRQEEEMI